MGKKILFLAAICLIAGGCGAMGPSSRGTGRDGRLLPSLTASKSGGTSFQRQVQNDPFPSADGIHTADMRVRVKQ